MVTTFISTGGDPLILKLCLVKSGPFIFFLLQAQTFVKKKIKGGDQDTLWWNLHGIDPNPILTHYF